MELPHTYEAAEMDKRDDTAIDVELEQLIEHGTEENAAVFARNFEMAMRIKRERFLGAQRYERTADRQCPRPPVMTGSLFTCIRRSEVAAPCGQAQSEARVEPGRPHDLRLCQTGEQE
jgi:hypothetical protein